MKAACGESAKDGASDVIIGVFAPLYPPAFRGGGPIRSIHALVKMAPEGLRPVVVTSNRDLGESTPLKVRTDSWVTYDGVQVLYASLRSFRKLFSALSELRKRKPALLHLNSFMHPYLSILPILLWKCRFWGEAEVLLTPRGEFGPAALRRRPFRKQAYMKLFRMLGLHKSVLWHSTSSGETGDLRRAWGAQIHVIERENQTLLPGRALRPLSFADGPLKLVFLGRIVEHKGLAVVLKALSALHNSVDLDIFGSDEDNNYLTKCRTLAAELPNHIRATFNGPVAPDEVPGVLLKYDALVMPTAGENFGHVILEALSASCPVLATPYTPWSDTLRSGGGLIVRDRSAEAWRAAIEQFAFKSARGRFDRRVAAGEAYERWMSRPRLGHIWSTSLNGGDEQ